MHALNEADTAWLLEVVKGTRFYLPVLLAVTSGIRRGEFLALRWNDVDLRNGIASVTRSVEQTNEGTRFKSPKGRKGRPIPLLSITIEALREHRELQHAQQKANAEAYRDEDLIYAREDGSLWKPDTFTADFARLAKKAGLSAFTTCATATRHSFSSTACIRKW